MALSANSLIVAQSPAARVSYPVAVNTHIYQGAMLFNASGYAGVAAAGAQFLGIATKEVDNSSGANGALTVEAFTEGVFELTSSSMAQSNVGTKMYATDDATLTATSTNNSAVGRTVEYVSATRIRVKIDVQQT